MNPMAFMVQQATAEPLPEPERVFPATSRRNEVLQLIRDREGISEPRICRALKMGLPQADRYVRMLIESGQVVRVGSGLRAVA